MQAAAAKEEAERVEAEAAVAQWETRARQLEHKLKNMEAQHQSEMLLARPSASAELEASLKQRLLSYAEGHLLRTVGAKDAAKELAALKTENLRLQTVVSQQHSALQSLRVSTHQSAQLLDEAENRVAALEGKATVETCEAKLKQVAAALEQLEGTSQLIQS